MSEQLTEHDYAMEFRRRMTLYRDALEKTKELTISSGPWTESKMSIALHDINRLIGSVLEER